MEGRWQEAEVAVMYLWWPEEHVDDEAGCETREPINEWYLAGYSSS